MPNPSILRATQRIFMFAAQLGGVFSASTGNLKCCPGAYWRDDVPVVCERLGREAPRIARRFLPGVPVALPAISLTARS